MTLNQTTCQISAKSVRYSGCDGRHNGFVDQEHVELTQRLECFPQNSPPSVFESSERKRRLLLSVSNNSPTGSVYMLWLFEVNWTKALTLRGPNIFSFRRLKLMVLVRYFIYNSKTLPYNFPDLNKYIERIK